MPRSYSCMPFFGANAANTFCALLGVEPAEIELVVAAQELHPLRVGRTLARLLERPDQRLDVGGRQRVEEPLVDGEVQHHLQPLALVAEVAHALVRRHVRLRQQDRVARSPLEEVAHLLEDVEVLLALDAGALLLDQERHGVHPEAGHAELPARSP